MPMPCNTYHRVPNHPMLGKLYGGGVVRKAWHNADTEMLLFDIQAQADEWRYMALSDILKKRDETTKEESKKCT